MPGLYTDNLLGEAMGLRPVVLMADAILKTPALKAEARAEGGGIPQAWPSRSSRSGTARGCWREVKAGGLWVVPPFGIDRQTGKWTEGYERRNTDGFSLPANKQNFVALWLLAMHEATKKPRYRERAEKWWRLMKSRMRLREGGKYFVWNYWDPAGPWDYKPDGSPKHWVGVHPNGGYYAIDVEGIVTAYEHGLVFDKEDLERLIATNRDFMWNQQIKGAKFQRIDGGKPDPRWNNSPGRALDGPGAARRDAAEGVRGEPQAGQLGRAVDDAVVFQSIDLPPRSEAPAGTRQSASLARRPGGRIGPRRRRRLAASPCRRRRRATGPSGSFEQPPLRKLR